MIRALYRLISLFFLVSGCVAAQPRSAISITSVDELKAGKAMSKSVIANFGEPSIKSQQGANELWRYQTSDGRQLLDVEIRPGGIVDGMLLIPRDGDRFLNVEQVIALLPQARFTATEKIDPVASDYRSGDMSYRDPVYGLAFDTFGRSNVSYILWYDPGTERVPSSRSK